ncbi:MAG: hypothetical protein V1921_06270 [Candidatus Altiarchaeota archaeon]
MTGTKIIKLKLEEGGTADKLPSLKVDVVDKGMVDKALGVYRETMHMGNFTAHPEEKHDEYHQSVLEATKDCNVNSATLGMVADILQSKDYVEEMERAKGAQFRSVVSDKMGFFLTALIQNSEHSMFRIKATKTMDYIGYQLKGDKTIIVDGNVGVATGSQMEGGTIIVDGSEQSHLGSNMRGGFIHLKGNARDYVGTRMSGGEIIIDGNVGTVVGREMTDGKITIGGNVESNVGIEMSGGEIHIKGDVERDWVGSEMRGGIIRVDGESKGVSRWYKRGEIWHKGKKVRPE